eukprot:TRINITY_DN14768_c0_g1_i4.p1 TRINITY_DN14768_c0_g1~~TRINITY_DN14768_c0_g1_i4.p1  ORF type:complete len:479 (-),score=105.20 TRINITY_DN14768_c0_g1_i4:353-1789(-)
MAFGGRETRSRTIASHAQGNLSSTLAAHRQRLAAAAAGSAAATGGARPPQLPPSATGYPLSSTTPPGSLVLPPVTPPAAGGPDPLRTPQRSPSSSFCSGAESPSASSFQGQASPPARASRSASFGAKALKTPKHSPPGSADSEASSRGDRKASKRSSSVQKTPLDPLSFEAAVAEAEAAMAADAQAVEDAVFARQLRDLDELSTLLGLSQDGRTSLDIEPFRPATGTSASASTTAPPCSDSAPAELEDASVSLDNAPLVDAFDSLQGAQRAHYDLQQFSLPHGCRIEQAAGLSAQFFFSIDVTDGPYTPSTLTFWIKVFDEFPEPGSVSIRCTQRIFHPNVDPETGRLDLREPLSTGQCGNHFKAVLLEIRSVIWRPSDSPAANADAAMLLQTDPDEFRRTVRSTLLGGEYRGHKFERLMATGKKAESEAASGGLRSQSSLSNDLQLKLMSVESIKEQLKAQVSAFQQSNTRELNCLL